MKRHVIFWRKYMSSFNLAQLNIARLVAPLDSPELADFVANLDRINALAEESQGFIWRFQTEDGNATAIKHFGDDFVVNMSVWGDIQSLYDYVYRSEHVEVMRRKREWFQKSDEAYMVLWWVSAGHIPSLEEGETRLQYLRKHGPTRTAFTFRNPFPASDHKGALEQLDVDGACPAT
jgi:hypothetical protein